MYRFSFLSCSNLQPRTSSTNFNKSPPLKISLLFTQGKPFIKDMMQRPRVNFDVMHIIISFLDKRDLARLSTTCKLYRRPALKWMLSSVEVFILPKLTSFLVCVLAETPVRAAWIKELTIGFHTLLWNFKSEVVNVHQVSLLTSILRSCNSLTTLRLPLLEKLLKADPHLGASIASLTALTHLDLVSTLR